MQQPSSRTVLCAAGAACPQPCPPHTSPHELLPRVTSMLLRRAEGQWRVRRGLFTFKGAFGCSAKCLSVKGYKVIWVLALALASLLGEDTPLSAAFSFPPVEETINHWWVLYLYYCAAPPPREPGCTNPESLRGGNFRSLVPWQQQQSVQKPHGLVDGTRNPESLFYKPHGAAASLPCFWRSM